MKLGRHRLLCLAVAVLSVAMIENSKAMVSDYPWTSPTGESPDNAVPGSYFNLGPTGIRAKLDPLDFQVMYVFPGSPADGKILVGDTIIGVNGNAFTTPFTFGFDPVYARTGGNGPPKDFGMAIEASEGGNGILTVMVQRGGTTISVPLTIRTMGTFSPTFPFNCPKSDLLFKEICAFLASKQGTGGDWDGDVVRTSLYAMDLLASGDPQYLPAVQNAAKFVAQSLNATDPVDLNNWPIVYGGIFLSEYYYATHDSSIVYGMQKVNDGLVFAQLDMGQYQHQKNWGGYNELGVMNGLAVLAWGMIKQTGTVSITQASLDKAYARVIYNTASDGNVAYGGSGVDWGPMDTDEGRTGAGVMAVNFQNSDGSQDAYVARGVKYLGDHQHYFTDCHGSVGVGMHWAIMGANHSTPQLRNILDNHIWYINMSRCPEPGQYVAQPSRGGSNTDDYWNFPRTWQAASIGFMLCLKTQKLQLSRYRVSSVPIQAPFFMAQPVDAVVKVGATPTLRAAVNGTGPFTFQWQKMAPGSNTWTNVTDGSGADTSFFTTAAIAASDDGTLYRTIATSAQGSATSNPAKVSILQVIPAAPSNLAASAGSATTINLSWIDNANSETQFKLERMTSANGTWSQIATPAANATSYSDNGLITGSTYYYRIRASNASGDSAYSNTASVTLGTQSSVLKVYLLAGQSNMEGQAFTFEDARSNLNDNGYPSGTTIEQLVNNPTYVKALPLPQYDFAPSFGASFMTPLTNAWCIHRSSGDGSVHLVQNTVTTQSSTWKRQELALQPGFGAEDGQFSRFGPELGMGQYMSRKITDPVYLFKSDLGGTTLAVDWRPPSAVAKRGGSVGINYTNTMSNFNSFLSGLRTELAANGKLAQYNNATSFEVCGFVWLQGFNDSLQTQYIQEYQANLVDLMTDIRTNLNQADLPQIIVEGSDGDPNMKIARTGAVNAVNQIQPGKAVFIGTSDLNSRGLDGGYHFEYLAENYLEIGWRIGNAIISNSYTGSSNGVVVTPGNGTGLKGYYFDNVDLTNLKLVRIDQTVNFDWGTGSPDPSIGPDTFSIRWAGQVQPLYSETYTFYTQSDDGIRLWVNGQKLVDNWTNHSSAENSGTITLVAGQKYDITMEFYENAGSANAMLSWSSPSQAKQIIPVTQLYPANSAPTIASAPWATPAQITLGSTSTLQVIANDADSDPLTYTWSMVSGPGNVTFSANGTTDTSTVQSTYDAQGVYTLKVVVSDGIASTSGTTTVTVNANNVVSALKINFQPAGSSVPSDYISDSGAVFGDRGNGISFGWSVDVSSASRDRNSPASPDQRYDTLIHMQKIPAQWLIAVPNGTYFVRIVAGDPSFMDSNYQIFANDVQVISGTPSSMQHWFDTTKQVVVTNGALKVTNGPFARNNKICFVEISTSQISSDNEPVFSNLSIKQVAATIDYTKSNSDALTVSTSVSSVNGNPAMSGLTVGLDVGGVIQSFKLNSKGLGSTSKGTCRVKINSKSKAWLFTFSIKNSGIKNAWTDLGLDKTVKSENFDLPISLTVGSQTFGGDKQMLFQCPKGTKATAR